MSFSIVMTHNSSVNFKFIHFLLWTKESHQSPNFDTFKCSGENLPNSSCHFSNHKPVFFQILHNSSVSRKITPLYFFSSNIIHSNIINFLLWTKGSHQSPNFDTFECSGENLPHSSCQF